MRLFVIAQISHHKGLFMTMSNMLVRFLGREVYRSVLDQRPPVACVFTCTESFALTTLEYFGYETINVNCFRFK